MKKTTDDGSSSSNTVKGQSTGRHNHSGKVQVPVGVERVLFLAARDDEFKNKLLVDRQSALIDSRARLRSSEAAMLTAISNEALKTMIEKIEPENPKRRRFMGLVAAAAASFVAATVKTVDADGKRQTSEINNDDVLDSDESVFDVNGYVDSDPYEATVEIDVVFNEDGGSAPDDDVDGDCDCRTVGAK